MSVRHEAFEEKLEEPGEIIIRWQLKRARAGDPLMLCAVNEDGEVLPAGRVLEFKSDGTIGRCAFVSVPGLQLEAERVVVT